MVPVNLLDMSGKKADLSSGKRSEKHKNVIRQNILEHLRRAEFHGTERSFKSSACFAGFVKLFVLLAITKQPFDVFTAEYM